MASAPASSSSAICCWKFPGLSWSSAGAPANGSRASSLPGGYARWAWLLVQTETQFYVARFLLGLAEAGFFPGVIVYLTHWFPKRDRAKALSGLVFGVPFSLALGAYTSGFLLQVRFIWPFGLAVDVPCRRSAGDRSRAIRLVCFAGSSEGCKLAIRIRTRFARSVTCCRPA